MDEVKLVLNGTDEGVFEIRKNGDRIAEMTISLSEKELTVYHTEVSAEAEGKGMAKKLLESMVAYAREHQLKVVPLCSYVHIQFRRSPRDYADVWKK